MGRSPSRCRARYRPTCREPCSEPGRRGPGGPCGCVVAVPWLVAWRRAWRRGGDDELAGALHAVEFRDGRAVSYVRQESEADASVFWHGGSVLALPEAGIPSQYSRFLEPEEFAGGLTVPIASHVHRLAADGGRVLFGVDDGAGDGGEVDDGEGIFLRIGEWDAAGALRSAQSVELERATWQHDIGVTADHLVFIESPTTRLPAGPRWFPCGALRVGARGGRLGRRGAAWRRWRWPVTAAGRGGGAVDPPRSLPGDARARRIRRARWGHRPVRLLLRRARGRATRRPLGVRRRRGRRGALGDRGHARRVGAVAHRGRADRAGAGGRTLCRVSTDGCPLGGCRLPLRLLTRDRLGCDSSDLRSWDRGRGGRRRWVC